MLRKQIISLSANYRQLIFATKLKHVGNLCQIRSQSGYLKHHKPKFAFKLYDSSKSSVVLDLLKFNFNDPNLDVSDISEALTKLIQLCEQQNLPPDEVVRVDFFTDLCALIDARANDLTLLEAVHILDLLCELKVDLSSKLILHLLDQVNKSLETASISDYNRIMQVIQKMPSRSTTQTIATKLAINFTLKIRTQFDENNIEFLLEAFRFACLYTYNENILNKIVDSLENINFESLPPQSILSLMETLNSIQRYSTEWDKMLLKVQNAVSMNIQKFENKDISIMLKKFSIKINDERLEQFYNKSLFDKAIQKLISSECDLTDGKICLEALIHVRHTSKEFLDYLSSLVYVENEIHEKYIHYETLFTMLEAFADLRYKPMCWEMFMDFFKKDTILKYSHQKLMYRAYHLACLGQYEIKILSKIFERDFDLGLNRFTHHNFLRLYQILKTAPNYYGPLPSHRQIKGFETLLRANVVYPCYTNLVEAVGGPEYVQSSIRTRLCHQFEHIIAFQPDGKPVAVNSANQEGTNKYLEDLIIPGNSKVVAVTTVPSIWYARNTNKMLGKFAVYFESLETYARCSVVTINGKAWQNLPKERRTDFLMGLIRKKLEEQ